MGQIKELKTMKIFNKIVVCLVTLAIFPIMYFMNIVRAVVSISEDSSLYTILSKLAEKTASSAMEITFSVKEIFQYISDGSFSFGGMKFDISKIPAELLSGKNWAIAAGILIVIALIIAIVIIGCALFTNAYKTITALGAGGAVCCFAALRCFAGFSSPYINGSVDIGEILAKAFVGESNNLLGSIGTSILKGAISVDSFTLGNAVTLSLIFFIGIALWELAYVVTLPEKKPTKAKK